MFISTNIEMPIPCSQSRKEYEKYDRLFRSNCVGNLNSETQELCHEANNRRNLWYQKYRACLAEVNRRNRQEALRHRIKQGVASYATQELLREAPRATRVTQHLLSEAPSVPSGFHRRAEGGKKVKRCCGKTKKKQRCRRKCHGKKCFQHAKS